MLFILDIDGTIADGTERFKAAGPEPDLSDKEAYIAWVEKVNTGIEMDSAVCGMEHIANALARFYQVSYVTSREEKHRSTTRQWLEDHGFPGGRMIMRPNGSLGSTAELKEAAIKSIQRNNELVVVIDDDEKGTIEAMCKRNGFTFLKARSGGQK